ncbi:MAG: hypothetical protein ACI85O_001870 [Saprospiraceae bacterium]|jgi:hypothetical protein
MTKQDAKVRLNLLFLQLRVMQVDRKSFIENEGESGFERRTNTILDEINILRKLIREDKFK